MKRKRLIGRRVSALMNLACLEFLIILALAGTGWGAASFEWEQTYNGRGNGTDWASRLALDPLGNVIVTGSATDLQGGKDIVTIKYRVDGQVLWAKRFIGPDNGDDYASALAVDAQGNIYVAGYMQIGLDKDNNADIVVLKYNSNGDLRWQRRYNGPANGWDSASALAVDALGNVYVTGTSYVGPGDLFHGQDFDYVTIKYNSNGARVWVHTYNGPASRVDGATALALDAQGNVYVTGFSDYGAHDEHHVSDMDYATIKYSPNGQELWVRRYNHINLDDQAQAMAVDHQGNVYVTGWSDNGPTPLTASDMDYATIKYSPNGDELWVSRYDHASRPDYPRALAVDQHDNVIVTGSSYGQWLDEFTPPNRDWATVKYSPDGREVWVSRYDSMRLNDLAYAIAVDSFDNIYVTGSTIGYDYYRELYSIKIIKYAYNGDERWAVSFVTHKDDNPYGIVVDSLENVYIAGGKHVGNQIDYFIRKYSQ